LREGFWEFARFFFAQSKFGPPRGITSVYQMLRAQWPPINGRIVLHDQGTPRVTEDSLLAKSGMLQYGEQPWPVLWSEHRDARLVTGSLALLLPDKTLCSESVYCEGRWRTDSASRYLTLPPATKLEGNWTSLVSNWLPSGGVPIYGHWFHNALPRLGLLPEFPPDTRIIVPANLKGYHRESLELMGVWDRCRPTSEQHLEVERYFFSSPVTMIDCYDPYGMKIVRDALLPKRDRTYKGPKKFYLHRTSRRRSVENGDEICDFFRSKGWDIVIDVDLTIAQTVTLFSEAEAFCSILGSNMSNAIFCSPGCTVMHLVTDSFLDGWIDWIAQVGQLDYHSRIFPVGGRWTTKMEIKPAAIEEFFVSSGVSF
jgi:capsular polysaccharide biosynthesis protein